MAKKIIDDKEADFLDYIDTLQQKEERQNNEELAAKLRKEWRETTWAGAIIVAVEKIGASNFFAAIGNSFQEGEDATSFYVTKTLYKIGEIVACIIFVYMVGRILRMIMGDEIVIEQEVVIVEEVTRSQVEAEERAARERSGEGGGEGGVVPTKSEETSTRQRRRGKRE